MAAATEVRSLTGLRGVAAVYVVIYHYFQASFSENSVWGRFVLHGYIAVDLFFILSGFVMMMVYGELFTNNITFEKYRKFLYNRISRIYPLYIAVTLLVFVFIYLDLIKPSVSVGNLVLNIFMIQSWGFGGSIGRTTWSISTEMFAYMLFPFLCVFLKDLSKLRFLVLTVICLLVIILVSTRTNSQVNQSIRSGPLDVFGPFTLYPLLRCLSGFITGLLAHRLVERQSLTTISKIHYLPELICATTVFLFATKNTDVILFMLFPLLVISLFYQRSFVSRLLASGPIHWLGLISYSVYVVHRALGDLLREPLTNVFAAWRFPHPYTLSLVLLIPLMLVIATCTYYGIEKPARHWGRRMASLGTRPIESDPPAP